MTADPGRVYAGAIVAPDEGAVVERVLAAAADDVVHGEVGRYVAVGRVWNRPPKKTGGES